MRLADSLASAGLDQLDAVGRADDQGVAEAEEQAGLEHARRLHWSCAIEAIRDRRSPANRQSMIALPPSVRTRRAVGVAADRRRRAEVAGADARCASGRTG